MISLEEIKKKAIKIWNDAQNHQIPFHEKYFFACIAMIVLSCSFYFFDDMNALALKADTTPVFSGGGLAEGNKIVRDNIEGVGIIEADSIVDTIVWLLKWVLIIAGILAVIAFIWAGILYITSFVNEENNETAKKVMIYAAIGILIIILSWTIVNFLTTFTI